MPHKPPETKWTSWDDSQLANLKSIVNGVSSARFHLENLRGNWKRMDDDETDPLVDQLLEVHQELEEIYETLKESADE